MDSIDSQAQATAFWRIFSRVLGRKIEPGHYAATDLSEWDSLRHVELIFELEDVYNVDIEPSDIVLLYSDTTAILRYLSNCAVSE